VINGLKPYPEMKDSGVPWLGEVPEHWQLRRMKTLLHERVEKGHPNEPLLAATQTKGVVRKDQYENRTVLALKDLHLLKLVRVGDFVISLRSFQGGIEYAHEQGIISPAYTILYPARAGTHDYLARMFKSRSYVENLSLFVTGIRQGQNIDYEKLRRAELPFPPLPEQAAIVRFLDHADRRIRRYIRAKQKLIKLLEEQKQAIIHGAVTRGLDPNVRLKPSGVEWLGDVPEHWEVGTLRRKLRPFDGIKIGPFGSQLKLDQMVESGYKVYGQANVIARDFVRGGKFIDENKFNELSACAICPGDLVITMMGTSGRCAEVPNGAAPGIMDSHLLRLRTTPDVDSTFAALVIDEAPYIKEQIKAVGKGSIMHGLNSSMIKNLFLALPPPAEQATIVRFLDHESHTIAGATAHGYREIDLLREYRTRLIADVVTGKLDVRDAAARLPDEVEEPESFDDIEAEGDTDGPDADSVDETPEEAET